MEKNWMTLINYLEGKYKDITPEILDTVAYVYACNAHGVNVHFCKILESIISIDKELNGKLLPNLYTIASLDFVKMVYAPGYQRWLIIDCVPIMCEYRTSEFEGLYIGVNMKNQQVIKGLELCKIFKPRWIKNIDDFGIPHLHNGDEVKFDDLGRACF